MSNQLFLFLLFLFFVTIPFLGYWLYKKQDISNKLIALFISVSWGLINFFVIVALQIFEEESVLFGGSFMILYLVIGFPFGVWLLAKFRKNRQGQE